MQVLAGKQSRLQAVNSRLEGLRETLASLKPIMLSGAGEIIMDVTRIYVDELPDRIAAYLKPVCPTYHRAIQIAKMCDCHTALLGIRNLAYGVNGLPATPNEVEKLKDILNRALRGRV